MRFQVYGAENNPCVILLHGAGLGSWSLAPLAKELARTRRVIAVDIDGYGAATDEDFESIGQCARELLQYIDENCGGRVQALCGLSLGAQIVLETLMQREDCTHYALVESALVRPNPHLARMAPHLCRMSYPLIQRNWFSKMQAKSLGVPKDMLEDYGRDSRRISLRTLIRTIAENESFHLRAEIEKTSARVLVVAGARENRVVRASARDIGDQISCAHCFLLPGLRHGELSLKKPQKWLQLFFGMTENLYFSV